MICEDSASSMTDGSDRLSLVSSLYGPGSIGCWLCTIASVFVSWTLNTESRHRDSITNDFIAALAIPLVATAHLFYLLFSPQRTAQLGEYAHFNQASLLTSPFPIAAQYAAAVEAPLNVC